MASPMCQNAAGGLEPPVKALTAAYFQKQKACTLQHFILDS